MSKKAQEFVKDARQSEEYWLEWISIAFTGDVEKRMEQLDLIKSGLAEELGTSKSYVTQLFEGSANFTLKTMVRIARALDSRIEVNLIPNEAVPWNVPKPIDYDRWPGFSKAEESYQLESGFGSPSESDGFSLAAPIRETNIASSEEPEPTTTYAAETKV